VFELRNLIHTGILPQFSNPKPLNPTREKPGQVHFIASLAFRACELLLQAPVFLLFAQSTAACRMEFHGCSFVAGAELSITGPVPVSSRMRTRVPKYGPLFGHGQRRVNRNGLSAARRVSEEQRCPRVVKTFYKTLRLHARKPISPPLNSHKVPGSGTGEYTMLSKL